MNGCRSFDLIKNLSTTLLYRANTLLARLNNPLPTNTVRSISSPRKREQNPLFTGYYKHNYWSIQKNRIILVTSSYKLNNGKFVRHYNDNSSKNTKSPLETGNKLTVKGSQRLMRQIYARVHPDLFTNHLEAQKLNEDSLKTLRNLIDFYVNAQAARNLNRSLLGFRNVSKSKHIEFYLKNNPKVKHREDEEVVLNKVQISLSTQSSSSIEDLLENVFNEFIEKLSLKAKKFSKQNPNERKLPSFLRSHGNNKYRVTYKNVKVNFNHEDDEFINDDQFEQWYDEYTKRNMVPSLRKWIKNNSQQILERIHVAQTLKGELNRNKAIVIKKWKLKDIIIKSNWSLQTSNSYVAQMLNYTSFFSDFSGQTLVLTNRTAPGLQKNGHIYLNCDQVYEEWLFILGFAKKEQALLHEIAEMELNLSMLLGGMKICDNLDTNKSLLQLSFDEQIDSARYYNKILHKILNRFTEELKMENADLSKFFGQNNFSNLQLTIQKVDGIYLNSIGQFVIGNHRKITHKDTVAYVKDNRHKAIKLLKKNVELLEEERTFLARVKAKGIVKDLTFDDSVNFEQRIKTMKQLINMANTKNLYDSETLGLLKNTEVFINNTSYSVNDDGSIGVPWNWYEYDANNN